MDPCGRLQCTIPVKGVQVFWRSNRQNGFEGTPIEFETRFVSPIFSQVPQRSVGVNCEEGYTTRNKPLANLLQSDFTHFQERAICMPDLCFLNHCYSFLNLVRVDAP